MISQDELHKQLKRIHVNPNGWGKSELRELRNILMPDEEVEECVNGYYDAGFALLVATKHRVLLIDKKPLNYLTVEDIRFDLISEFDYSHRVIGAHVSISSGNKTLDFTSLNQLRLRSLLTYVQTRMTEIKKTMHNQQETQQQHLERMNEQLQQYLNVAQKQEQLRQLNAANQQPGYQSSQPALTLPTPQRVDSADAFERVAAESAGLADRGRQLGDTGEVERQTMRRLVLTPQEVGVGAMRRVIPILAAYSRVPMVREHRHFARRPTALGVA